MPELQFPSTTRHVVCHNESDVAHVVEVASSQVCTTGQPVIEGYDTPAEPLERALAINLSAEEMQNLVERYDEWQPDEFVQGGDVRRYNGTLYRVNDGKGHTTQVGWEPDVAVSEWSEATPAGVIPAWTPPTGAQDAYYTDGSGAGDRCTHNGYVWVTQIDANTVEPGTQPEHNYWKKQI